LLTHGEPRRRCVEKRRAIHPFPLVVERAAFPAELSSEVLEIGRGVGD